jgi:aspartate racemase
MKIIGILGGMGPEASADLYQQLIDRFYRRAGSDMHGYPHIIINNIPVPDIYQQAGIPIGKYLGEQTAVLEKAGAQVIGIACNSAHNYFNEIRNELKGSAEVIDMIAEVASSVRNAGFRKVGLMSTTMSKLLYLRALDREGLSVLALTPDEQIHVENIIHQILSGLKTISLRDSLKDTAASLMSKGAECIILGCTDLPLLLKSSDVQFPLYSSTTVLADVLFRKASGA